MPNANKKKGREVRVIVKLSNGDVGAVEIEDDADVIALRDKIKNKFELAGPPATLRVWTLDVKLKSGSEKWIPSTELTNVKACLADVLTDNPGPDGKFRVYVVLPLMIRTLAFTPVMRLPRWKVKLSDPLCDILSRPVPPCISYYHLANFGFCPIDLPHAVENYDFAPALLYLVEEIASNGDFLNAFRGFCGMFGAPIGKKVGYLDEEDEGALEKVYKPNRCDASLLVNSVTVCDIEDRVSATKALVDPYEQLKMGLWLPHHSNLRWRLGIVKDATSLSFVPLVKVRDKESFRTDVRRG